MPSANAALVRLLPILLLGTGLTVPALAQDDDALAGLEVADGTDMRGTNLRGTNLRGPTLPGPTLPGAAGPGSAVPPSASVVDRRDLNTLNAQTLEQAVAYTPEASIDTGGYDPRGDGIDIRGFDTTYNAVYRDGLHQVASNLAVPRNEPYGLESVAVLRGPAAGIYGFNAPAGILSLTTKQPKFEPFGEVQLQAGNYDRYQGNFDIGGPIEGSDGTMAYRLTGVLRQSKTFLPGAPDDRTYLAPAFTWKPDADTTFTVLTEFMRTRLPSNPNVFYYDGYVVSRVPQTNPRFDTLQQDQYRVGYVFEHRFSSDLIVRQNFRYAGLTLDFPAFALPRPITRAGFVPGGTGFLILSRENLGSLAIDNQIEHRFETGSVTHALLGGVDYVRYDDNFRSGVGSTDERFNVYTVNYNRLELDVPSLENRSRQTQSQLGVYLQEQAKVDDLTLTLSGRHDQLNSRNTFNGDIDRSKKNNNGHFTYRIGSSYALTQSVVPYASYATTFTPQPGVTSNLELPLPGQPIAPFTGRQLEVGAKLAVPGTSITGSVSAFNIEERFSQDIDLTTYFYQAAPGSVISRGFEMEASASPAPGTSVTLAYRKLDFDYTRQDARTITFATVFDRKQITVPLDGNNVSGIPGNTLTAFGTYLFPAVSPLAGVTIGAGIRFTGPSFVRDDDNVIRNPTVSLFDAVAAYDLAALDPRYKGFRAQINGFNVLDRKYTVCQNLFCLRGAPATVIGSLVYRW